MTSRTGCASAAPAPGSPSRHPFERRPHRTLLGLSAPIFFSLVAEPVTGLVDTAFVARLGAVELAALGLATTLLSSVFWVFFFLGVGAQTEVASALGAGDRGELRALSRASLLLALACGAGLALLLWPFLAAASRAMGASAAIEPAAVEYLEIRLLGAPAVVAAMTAFGVLRGLHDMRTPLWIAVGINGLNIVLDRVLIFGAGPVPALGLGGAAWASAASQWVGLLSCLLALRGLLTWRLDLPWRMVRRLLVAGRDLVIRTGSLSLFLLMATRAATELGPEAGAAHQVIRQFWMFTALFLDAYAHAAQSLVAFFTGGGRVDMARRVALVALQWGVVTGVALGAAMVIGQDEVVRLLVPGEAAAVFLPAWLLSALFQPVNAASFVTDGVHWGTRDYTYLRNAMVAVTATGVTFLIGFEAAGALDLDAVWAVTGLWITLRAVFGVVRVWPGIGRAPLSLSRGACYDRCRQPGGSTR